MSYEPVVLKRDVEAIQIPYGQKHTLTAGTQVAITQTLGGSFTVQTDIGLLVRIEGKDGDALGKKIPREAERKPANAEGAVLETLVWEQLRTVYDPEIPINVVDLGLIYECKIFALPEGGNKIEGKMSMTAPGCSMGDVLKGDAKRVIKAIPNVKEVNVEVVFDPPWNQSMMSEAAKLQLGMM